MKRKLIIRYILLGVLLLLVWMTQSIPALGNLYSQTVYPVISRVLSFFSNLFPFAIGDLFIFGSYARIQSVLRKAADAGASRESSFILFMPVSARNCRGKGFCYVTENICYGFTYGSTSRGG